MDKGERKLTEKELKRMENEGLKPPIFENTAVSGNIFCWKMAP